MKSNSTPPSAHRLTSYIPDQHENGKEGVDGRQIHGIIIPTGLGNRAHDEGDARVAEGGQYVWEALQAILQRDHAIVSSNEIPVQDIAADVRITNPEAISAVNNAPEIVAVTQETARHVYEAMMAGKIPALMEGDHSAVLGLSGALKIYRDTNDPEFSTLKIVFFDAHTDILQEPVPGGGKNAYGRTLSTLLGKGPKDLMPLMEGVPKLRPENLLYIGTQLPDAVEIAFINAKKIKCIDLDLVHDDPAETNRMIDEFLTMEQDGQLVPAPFHCELDVDAITGHKGNPMPNDEGLTRNDLFRLVRRAKGKGKLVSLGIAEVAKKLDVDRQTLRIAVGFAARLLGMGDPNYYGEGYTPHMGATTA